MDLNLVVSRLSLGPMLELGRQFQALLSTFISPSSWRAAGPVSGTKMLFEPSSRTSPAAPASKSRRSWDTLDRLLWYVIHAT